MDLIEVEHTAGTTLYTRQQLLGLLPLDFKSDTVLVAPGKTEFHWTVLSKSKTVHRMTHNQKRSLLQRLSPSESLSLISSIEQRVDKLMSDLQALEGIRELGEAGIKS